MRGRLALAQDYPAWTYVLLRRFGVYLTEQFHNKHEDPVVLARVDELLGYLPPLWEFTWKNNIMKLEHRIPFQMSRYKNETEDLSNSFIHTLDVMNNLYVLRQ